MEINIIQQKKRESDENETFSILKREREAMVNGFEVKVVTDALSLAFFPDSSVEGDEMR